MTQLVFYWRVLWRGQQLLECRRLVSWSYCEAGKELSCLQWHLTDNCHPIYLSPRLAKKCMFDKQICNCELLKPVAESAFNCELKASLPGGGGSPSLYSCQLDAVVGDVREATRRKAGGWGGRWGGHARSALPVIGSVDRAGFDIVRFPKSMWGGKPDMVWDKSLDIIIT